jgi:hypothetical protein
VTYTAALGTPASESALLSRRPDLPTKGLPSMTSWAPGASPTITRLARFMHLPRTRAVLQGAFVASSEGGLRVHLRILGMRSNHHELHGVAAPRCISETGAAARSSSSHRDVLREAPAAWRRPAQVSISATTGP